MENDNAKFKMSDNFTFLTVILIFSAKGGSASGTRYLHFPFFRAVILPFSLLIIS